MQSQLRNCETPASFFICHPDRCLHSHYHYMSLSYFSPGPSGAEDGAHCIMSESLLHICILGFIFAKHFSHASFFLSFAVHSSPSLRNSSLIMHHSRWCWSCPLVVIVKGQYNGSGSPRADTNGIIFGDLSTVCDQSAIPVA